jgi:hypothetical protein
MPITSHLGMKDLIGLKFNLLTILKEDGYYANGTKLYSCQCECGGFCTTSYQHLKRGEVKSCGCLAKQQSSINGSNTKKDLTNQVFGRLFVLEEAGKSKNGTILWKCFCLCEKSTEIIVSGTNLRRGSTKSCGCLASELTVLRNKKKRSEFPWKSEIKHYELSAASRGYEFNLSLEEFHKLLTSNCYYCGKEPNKICYTAFLKELNILKNGIDRLDSSLGYVLENCVSCCSSCNFEKGTQSIKEFVENTIRRFQHLKSINLISEDNML